MTYSIGSISLGIVQLIVLLIIFVATLPFLLAGAVAFLVSNAVRNGWSKTEDFYLWLLR